jgi:hypothetical protein
VLVLPAVTGLQPGQRGDPYGPPPLVELAGGMVGRQRLLRGWSGPAMAAAGAWRPHRLGKGLEPNLTPACKTGPACWKRSLTELVCG